MRFRAFVILGLAILIALTAFPGQAQAAELTVTKTEDTFDGICDDDCSLREAIAVADPGDNIVVPAGIYTLTLGVQITIEQDLSLSGSGADVTIIQAALDPDVVDYPIFSIRRTNVVTISGMTIRHGHGIQNSGMLTLVVSATYSERYAESDNGF